MSELLYIVDEDDQIVGQAKREDIHKQGFRHREVGVWIYNDKGEVLLQRRAPDKDIAPNLLDTSAGGHVGIRESYEEAALKELKEETGITAKPEELVFIVKDKRFSGPQPNGLLNRTVRKLFAYRFKPDTDHLRLEQGKISSLEWRPMEKLGQLTDEEKKEFSNFVILDIPIIYTAIKKLPQKHHI
ncbi:MAG: NUDIX domain-containing protein [Patescibacteria group bacterium]|jgi:isopentenyldiphosphate isomerase